MPYIPARSVRDRQAYQKVRLAIVKDWMEEMGHPTTGQGGRVQ